MKRSLKKHKLAKYICPKCRGDRFKTTRKTRSYSCRDCGHPLGMRKG